SFTLDGTSTAGATGTFSGSPCTLAQSGVSTTTSTCQVTYTPTSTAGNHVIKGAYSGSTVHALSSGTTTIVVNKRTTTTSVSCDSPRALNQATTCTATVADTESGTTSFPTGTVSFTLDGTSTAGATGTFSGRPDAHTPALDSPTHS